MKTNFLYFRKNGYQEFTATGGQTAFTINGIDNWDVSITGDTQVKVSVTALADGTDNVGTSYLADGDAVAGTTYVLDSTDGYAYNANVITIANITGSGTKGYDIKAGDIVTISRIPVEGSEAALRSDALLSVHSDSATDTEVTFKSSDGAATDDIVIFTHADDNGVALKKIAEYFNSVCGSTNINKRGGVITVWDKQNGVIARELSDAGVTKMKSLNLA